MLAINGQIQFEGNEKEIWENLLERKIHTISAELLRALGEARVTELTDEGNLIWARMAAEHVLAIPAMLH